jgi:hypothetical protein
VALNDDVEEIVRIQATAGYIFAADNARVQRPFDSEIGAALAKKLNAAEVSVHSMDRPFWVLRQGVVRFSEQRSVTVSTLAGGAHEFTAIVEGSTADAVDVLREAWALIGELTDEAASDLSQVAGSFSNSTTAILKLSMDYAELLPPVDVMMGFVRDKLGAAVMEAPGSQRFRLQVPVSVSVRGLTIERNLVIEPRFTSLASDRIYFTVSPLDSEDHVEMIRQVVRRARRRRETSAT